MTGLSSNPLVQAILALVTGVLSGLANLYLAIAEGLSGFGGN